MQHIYLIGPGGVGKTSAGRLLAPMIGCAFVDLDEEFVRQLGPIRAFLDEHGYCAYVRRNAAIFRTLLDHATAPLVMALSSGFLVTDAEPETITANREAVRNSGVSVLLMPSRSYEESSRVVVERQLGRGLHLERVSQTKTFAERFAAYMQLGDCRVFGTGSPQEMAVQVRNELCARHTECA